MEISDINLEFLWEKKEFLVLDGPDPFREKWLNEEIKYRDFIKTEPLEKVIELIIISFRDLYPRNLLYRGLSIGIETGKNIYKDGDYKVSRGRYVSRNDIYMHKWLIKEDEYDIELKAEHIFEFYNPISLNNVIEDNLTDKDYSKETTTTGVLYKVLESPIAEIETTEKSFRLKINEDFHVLYSL